MITILEDSSPSYRNRTEANVRISDGTLAFAFDFNTAGERLTYNLCIKHSKPILRILLRNPLRCVDEVVEKIISWLQKYNIKKLNIAGNGIYTLRKYNFTQEQITIYLYRILEKITQQYRFDEIRSGGQTGTDEASVKAADMLGIKAVALYPKGFKIRLENGKDYSDKILIENRLNYVIDTNLILNEQKYN